MRVRQVRKERKRERVCAESMARPKTPTLSSEGRGNVVRGKRRVYKNGAKPWNIFIFQTQTNTCVKDNTEKIVKHGSRKKEGGGGSKAKWSLRPGQYNSNNNNKSRRKE